MSKMECILLAITEKAQCNELAFTDFLMIELWTQHGPDRLFGEQRRFFSRVQYLQELHSYFCQIGGCGPQTRRGHLWIGVKLSFERNALPGMCGRRFFGPAFQERLLIRAIGHP